MLILEKIKISFCNWSSTLRQNWTELAFCCCDRIGELETERAEMQDAMRQSMRESNAKDAQIEQLQRENLALHHDQVVDADLLQSLAMDKAHYLSQCEQLKEDNRELLKENARLRDINHYTPVQVRAIAERMALHNVQARRLDQIAGVAAGGVSVLSPHSHN